MAKEEGIFSGRKKGLSQGLIGALTLFHGAAAILSSSDSVFWSGINCRLEWPSRALCRRDTTVKYSSSFNFEHKKYTIVFKLFLLEPGIRTFSAENPLSGNQREREGLTYWDYQFRLVYDRRAPNH